MWQKWGCKIAKQRLRKKEVLGSITNWHSRLICLWIIDSSAFLKKLNQISVTKETVKGIGLSKPSRRMISNRAKWWWSQKEWTWPNIVIIDCSRLMPKSVEVEREMCWWASGRVSNSQGRVSINFGVMGSRTRWGPISMYRRVRSQIFPAGTRFRKVISGTECENMTSIQDASWLVFSKKMYFRHASMVASKLVKRASSCSRNTWSIGRALFEKILSCMPL